MMSSDDKVLKNNIAETAEVEPSTANKEGGQHLLERNIQLNQVATMRQAFVNLDDVQEVQRHEHSKLQFANDLQADAKQSELEGFDHLTEIFYGEYYLLIQNAYIKLIESYQAYAGKDVDLSRIERTYIFAAQAHANQKRLTGEPYIIHPLSVAEILTGLEVDEATICAALLHDTVEDTGWSLADITEKFGSEIALLVDGVTKLGKMTYSSKEELQAENFRKLFLAMAQDIRVVLIKLADRLHNMRTLKSQRGEKQERISQETLDIYAPLADRLGVYKWKWELEDLCLLYLDRDAYYELVGAITQKRAERERYLDEVIEHLAKLIGEMNIKCEIDGRPKHFYSIYRKMRNKGKHLDQIYDLFACRVIVDTVADCYSVLGLVHKTYTPIPGRFKDYIAMPKPNMYQSLHTTVLGPKGYPFEVQIRTFAMHRTAEYGIAAHWKYKAGITDKEASLEADNDLPWLKNLVEWQKDFRDSKEYMDSLKTGLVIDEVFVITPRGDVIGLPSGSIPIDLAYTIHSGVGNHMYGAKVNGKIVPLTYELQNGDIVEILTSDKIHGPSRDWLNIVKSSTARNKITHWFKQELRTENIARGKSALDKEVKKIGFSPLQLSKSEYADAILKRYSFKSMEDLYAAIGDGTSGLTAAKIAPRLRDSYLRSLSAPELEELGYYINRYGNLIYNPIAVQLKEEADSGNFQIPPEAVKKKRAQNELGIEVKDIDNCKVNLSRCCSPVPGDNIIGYITRGRGVTVHRQDCSNIRSILEKSSANANEAERASRLIEVNWNIAERKTIYPVALKIMAHDRRHLFGDISNALADEKINIVSGSMNSVKDVTAVLALTIEISSQEQYNRIIGRLKAIPDVIDVKRDH